MQKTVNSLNSHSELHRENQHFYSTDSHIVLDDVLFSNSGMMIRFILFISLIWLICFCQQRKCIFHEAKETNLLLFPHFCLTGRRRSKNMTDSFFCFLQTEQHICKMIIDMKNVHAHYFHRLLSTTYMFIHVSVCSYLLCICVKWWENKTCWRWFVQNHWGINEKIKSC